MRYAPPPSPGRAQHTLLHKRVGRHPADPRTPRRAAQTPVHLALFDIPHLGQPPLTLPYTDRHTILERLGLDGPYWSTPAALTGHSTEALRATREHGLEGLVRKRLDSAHEPGVRSRAWIKIRNLRGEDVLVGGRVPGEGRAARAARRVCRVRCRSGSAPPAGCGTSAMSAPVGARPSVPNSPYCCGPPGPTHAPSTPYRRWPARARWHPGRSARSATAPTPGPGCCAGRPGCGSAAAAPGPRTGGPEDRRSPRRIYPSVKEVA